MSSETQAPVSTRQPTYNSELKNLPVFLRRVGRWVVLHWPQSRLLIRNGTVTMSRGKVACESKAHAIAVRDGLLPTTWSFMSPPPLDMNAYCCTLLTAANAAAHAASVARADAALVASGSAAAGVPEGGFVAPYNLSALTLNADDRHTEAPEEVEQGWLKLGSLILSCYESASDASRLAAVTNGLGHSIIRNLLTVEANLSVNVRQSIETKYKV